MFKIHQRYLAATFIPPFVLASAIFVLFLLTFYLLRFTTLLVNKGVTWDSFLLLTAHMGLMLFPFAIPLATLLACIYTLNKLSEDSEIVAMRAFGVSKVGLFLPFLIIGLLVAGVLFSLNKNIIPFSTREVRNTQIKFASNAMLKQIKAEEFFGEIPGLTLYASGISEDGRQMKKLMIFKKDIKLNQEEIIMAEEGSLVGGKDTIADLMIELKRGSIVRRNLGKGDVEKISFQRYLFPPFEKAPSFGLINRAYMRGNESLKKEIGRVKKNYEKSLKTGKNIEGRRRDYHTNLLAYYQRFNTPLVVLACILLGFSVGIKNGRGKDKNSALLAIGVFLPYYGLFFWLLSESKKGALWPSVAIFGPTILFFLAGYWFYRRMDWVS